MDGLTRIQRIGLAIVMFGSLIGIGGTGWGIYTSFDALKLNENAGIGAVGAGIFLALVFTTLGLVGSLAGCLLIVFGRAKSSRE